MKMIGLLMMDLWTCDPLIECSIGALELSSRQAGYLMAQVRNDDCIHDRKLMQRHERHGQLIDRLTMSADVALAIHGIM